MNQNENNNEMNYSKRKKFTIIFISIACLLIVAFFIMIFFLNRDHKGTEKTYGDHRNDESYEEMTTHDDTILTNSDFLEDVEGLVPENQIYQVEKESITEPIIQESISQEDFLWLQKFVKTISYDTYFFNLEKMLDGTDEINEHVKFDAIYHAVEHTTHSSLPSHLIGQEHVGKNNYDNSTNLFYSFDINEFKDLYLYLFHEDITPKEILKVGEHYCPAAYTYDSERVYFVSNCGGLYLDSQDSYILSYTEDESHYYVREKVFFWDFKGMDVHRTKMYELVASKVLLWTFDKDLNFLNAMAES